MKNKRRYKQSNLNRNIIEYINNNLIEYIIILIIFLIGITLGTFYVKSINQNQQQEISIFINNFLEDIKNEATIDFNKLLQKSIQNNLLIVFLLWIAGLTVIGMPILYLIVAFKGFSIGYTISSIISSIGSIEGIKFVLSTMFLQNIVIIPSILILAVSGIKLYKSIMKDRRRENIKVEILKYTIITAFIGGANILAGIIETYISANIFKFLFVI